MRFGRFIGPLALIAGLSGCKSLQPTSQLMASQARQDQFKTCIVSTILESYAASKPDIKAVNAFATELVQRAPAEDASGIDAAFEDYAETMGCDPSKVGSKSTLGNMIVSEWAISPHNPALANPSGAGNP